MSDNTRENSLKVLAECKKELAEFFELIRKLRNIEPEQFVEALKNLNPKEKAVFSSFLEKGEICLKLQEIRNKEPLYIK